MWPALVRLAATQFGKSTAKHLISKSQSSSTSSTTPKAARQQFTTGSYGPTEPQVTAHMSSPGSKY